MFLDAAQLNQRILDLCDPFLTQLPSGVKLQGFPRNIKIILPERKIFHNSGEKFKQQPEGFQV